MWLKSGLLLPHMDKYLMWTFSHHMKALMQSFFRTPAITTASSAGASVALTGQGCTLQQGVVIFGVEATLAIETPVLHAFLVQQQVLSLFCLTDCALCSAFLSRQFVVKLPASDSVRIRELVAP